MYMIVKKKDAKSGDLFHVAEFKGSTVVIQRVIEKEKHIGFGEKETVDSRTISVPCVTSCLEVAKNFHKN